MAKTKSSHVQERRRSFWIAPMVGALLAIIVAGGLLALDHRFDFRDKPFPVFVGEADTARELLSVIAASVTTLIALVFTILAVVIQLASSQYSPRALHTLLQDRPTHMIIGIFVGTFTYCLVLLLAFRITVDEGTAAGVSVTVAFVLAILSIGSFAAYSNHIIHSVRITHIIGRIARQTRGLIDREFGDDHQVDQSDAKATAEPVREVRAPKEGLLVDFDEARLLDVAARENLSLQIVPPIGAYVPQSTVLLTVHGPGQRSVDALARLVNLSSERNTARDLGFGLRQLVDIAVRALSSGINDPATAVQVLDHVHGLLRTLATRRLGNRERRQGGGRLLWRTPTWDDLTTLALDEVRLYGSQSLQVHQRLRYMLLDLLSVAPPDRRPSLSEQLELLDASVERAFDDPSVREQARRPDPGGLAF